MLLPVDEPSQATAGAAANQPWFVVALCVAMGLVIVTMSVFAGDEKFNAPRWLVALAGSGFVLAGMMLGLARARHAHPALYLFFGACLVTIFPVLGGWIALFATGPFTMSAGAGGMSVHGEGGNILGRVAFGLGCLITLPFALWSWRRWFRALRGDRVNVD